MRRPAYLAGQWYPGTESACLEAIEGHAAETCVEQGQWRGLIGPHAGWFFSGDAAGHSYRWLADAVPSVDLVVVVGSHRGPTGTNTIFRAEAWETPLGPLMNAVAIAARFADELQLEEEPARPTRPDNAVELHLPFVRHFFPKAEMLMLGVAANDQAAALGSRVGELCREITGEVVFVGSTDLTHYGPNYGFESAGEGKEAIDWVRGVNDRGFLDLVLAGDASGVVRHGNDHRSACCPGAVAATLRAVEAYGGTEKPKLVDHYLSCDIQPGSSFVGYAGIVL